MTLAGTLEALSVAADTAADALCAARITVCEDQPHGTSTLAVDELAEALIELDGEAGALRDRIRAVALAPVAPSREQVLELISLAQRALNDMCDTIASRIASRERRTEVERAARRGGAPWTRWWLAASRGLAECEAPLRDLRDALFGCWRELASDGGLPAGDRSSGASYEPRTGSELAVARGVSARGDLSGQVVFRTFVEEPAGGPEQ